MLDALKINLIKISIERKEKTILNLRLSIYFLQKKRKTSKNPRNMDFFINKKTIIKQVQQSVCPCLFRKRGDMLDMTRHSMELQEFMQKHNINPFKVLYLYL